MDGSGWEEMLGGTGGIEGREIVISIYKVRKMYFNKRGNVFIRHPAHRLSTQSKHKGTLAIYTKSYLPLFKTFLCNLDMITYFSYCTFCKLFLYKNISIENYSAIPQTQGFSWPYIFFSFCVTFLFFTWMILKYSKYISIWKSQIKILLTWKLMSYTALQKLSSL